MVQDTKTLLGKIRSGDRIALSKAITLIESTLPDEQKVARQLISQLKLTGKTLSIAISGSPGVGKSTFIDILGHHLIESGHRVAVLAVDPTSPLSRGSILGDKTRMLKLGRDHRAFIRPSPTSGVLGGVGAATFEISLICREAGFDFVLIETVGVGQTEILARHLSDFFILLLQPGAGDELQGMKKGILEQVDLMIVNKWDGNLVAEALKTATQFKSVWSGDHEQIHLVSALEDRGIQPISDLLIKRLENPASESIQREREKFWFMDRTKREILAHIMEKNAELLRHLQAEILSGKMNYSDAIEEALNKICPR